MEDKLANELGILPLTDTLPSQQQTAVVVTPTPVALLIDTVPDDYEFARRKIRELMDQGMVSIKDLNDLASQASSVYAYETIAGMIQSISKTGIDLMTLAEKKKKIMEAANGQNSLLIANNMFIGGTHQLCAILKEQGILDITNAVFEEDKLFVGPPVEPEEHDEQRIPS